jgi:iron complex outermembrane receptor protein
MPHTNTKTGERQMFETTSKSVVALAIAGSVVLGTPALAQNNSSDERGSTVSRMMDEVTVSARKREEGLQSAPIAITAQTGESLEARGVTQLDEMAAFAPNVTFQNNPGFSGASSSAAVYIRGIGQQDFLPTVEPGVGLYVDGVYIARSVGSVLDLVDIERIEILRGPQGTLFGRNTIGGAINVTTKKPHDEFEAKVDFTFGSGERIDAKGIVNIPLSDKLFLKVAFASLNQEGYVERIADGVDLGDRDSVTGRAALRWVPNDRLEVNLAFDGTRTRENGPALTLADTRLNRVGGTDLNSMIFNPLDANGNFDPSLLNPPLDAPSDNFALLHNYLATFLGGQDCLGLVPGQPIDGGGNLNNPACYNDQFVLGMDQNAGTAPSYSNIDIWGLALTVDYDVNDSVAIKSITSYREIDAQAARDGDQSPHTIAQFFDDIQQEQFSQELQLSVNAFDDQLKWITGFYFFQEDGLNVNLLQFVPADFRSGGFFDNQNWAIFTQATYYVTDAFSITGGIRYTDEKKKFLPDQIIFADRTLAPQPGGGLGPAFGVGTRILPFEEVQTSITEFTPMVNVAYEFDNAMIYATYSEGFKSGGFNQRVFPPLPETPSFDPEFAKVFEVGVKYTTPDNRLRVNAAAFHTDYDDLQVQIFRDVAPITSNAASAKIKGFELEVAGQPFESTFVELTLGYTDADFKEIDQRATEISLASSFERVSKWTFSAGISHEIMAGNGGYVIPRLDWSYRSSFYNDALNSPEIFQDGFHLLNANIAWIAPDEQYSLTVGVTNLTDERFLRTGIYSSTFNAAESLFDRGREWFINVKVNI